jgi:hypothetical protein
MLHQLIPCQITAVILKKQAPSCRDVSPYLARVKADSQCQTQNSSLLLAYHRLADTYTTLLNYRNSSLVELYCVRMVRMDYILLVIPIGKLSL